MSEDRDRSPHYDIMSNYTHVRNALNLLRPAEVFGLKVGEYPEVQAL